MNGIEGMSLSRDNTDLQFAENVLQRLLQLEAFIFRRLDENREFLSRTEEEKGATVKHEINELEAFQYLFGSGDYKRARNGYLSAKKEGLKVIIWQPKKQQES